MNLDIIDDSTLFFLQSTLKLRSDIEENPDHLLFANHQYGTLYEEWQRKMNADQTRLLQHLGHYFITTVFKQRDIGASTALMLYALFKRNLGQKVVYVTGDYRHSCIDSVKKLDPIRNGHGIRTLSFNQIVNGLRGHSAELIIFDEYPIIDFDINDFLGDILYHVPQYGEIIFNITLSNLGQSMVII